MRGSSAASSTPTPGSASSLEDHQRAPGELRFDTFEAEYTHEGDRCTFETLLGRFGLVDPALSAIAEVVHDIDCKDGKFARGETAGAERLIAGIVRRHVSDAARVEHGAAVLDDLYDGFADAAGDGRKPGGRKRPRAAPRRRG